MANDNETKATEGDAQVIGIEKIYCKRIFDEGSAVYLESPSGKICLVANCRGGFVSAAWLASYLDAYAVERSQ